MEYLGRKSGQMTVLLAPSWGPNSILCKYGEKIIEALKDAQPLHPENGIKTRVYYKGIPKRFIAGAVYDEGKDADSRLPR